MIRSSFFLTAIAGCLVANGGLASAQNLRSVSSLAGIDRGEATIDYDLAAWATLASGFSTPPVLFLDEVFDQEEANATDYNGTLSIDVDVSPSGTGLVYEMNGPAVANMTGRTAQPTDFAFRVNRPLQTHSGEIGLGGITRWDVLPGGIGGHLLFGDFTLLYDASRIGLGGSGWCLLGNIAPAGVVFDLLNVQVDNHFGAITIQGDLGISFELANFLFVTPSDHLVDVGDFLFVGIDTVHVVQSSVVTRLGSPANPMAFFPPGRRPRIGDTWAPSLSHLTFAPTAVTDFVIVSGAAANLVGAGGTLLCNPPHTTYSGIPGVPLPIPIPFDTSMIGRSFCSQGGSILPGGAVVYANALDVVIGF